MKQKFEPVEVEVICFDLEDIIATSSICPWQGEEGE